MTEARVGVAEVAASTPGPLLPLLRESLALRMAGAVDAARAASWAASVKSAREAWVSDFGGSQFSLGRAWYTHLEQERADEYFAKARASDVVVERACPGLQGAMRELVARVVGAGERVVAREGWCGPGVHVFPAGGLVATRGGEIHFDVEGLTDAHVAARAPALTLVLMLDAPQGGGGLRVWEELYDDDAEGAGTLCVYDACTLVVIDSYRLHQIEPFGGTLDRISATCHAAYVAGAWETWF